MKAIVLAAGTGSRLRPLTEHTPKCMVKIFEKPILKYQIDIFNELNINQKLVVGGHCAEKINIDGIEVVTNSDYLTTNMVYSLFCAIDFMSDDEDLLISYGDIIYEKEVLKTLIASEEPLSVVVDNKWKDLWDLRMENPLDDAETLKLDQGKIYEIGKKPQSYSDIHAQYIGLIKVRSDYVCKFKSFWVDLIRDVSFDSRNLYMTDYLQLLIDSGEPVTACGISGGWLEVDTIEDLSKYQILYGNGEIEHFINLRG